MTAELPTHKSDDVLVLLIDYMSAPALDAKLMRMLISKYKRVYCWLQGEGDSTYIGSLGFPVTMLDHSLKAINDFLYNHTSKYEGFPNTFVQAWLRDVPVISLNVDPDGILKRENIVFHSGSFEQLVKDTKLLVEDELLRNQMGSKAKGYADANHSLKKNVDKVIELIER